MSPGKAAAGNGGPVLEMRDVAFAWKKGVGVLKGLSIAVQRGELERQVNVIRQQQDRIRENLKVLPKDADVARTYIKKFTEQEQQNDLLVEKITASAMLETKERRELDDYLIKLDVK